MKKLFAPLLASLAVLLLGGCGSSTDIITSGLRTGLVRLQPAGNGDLRVTWQVRNPNVVPYVLGKAVLKLSLDGTPIGTVTDNTRLGVPPTNQIEQTSVLTPTGPGAAQAVAQALARGSAGYTLDASFWMVMEEDKQEKFHLAASGTVAVAGP